MDPGSAKVEIHLFHHTLGRTGGKERYGIALAQGFRRLGHPVTFYALRGDDDLARQIGVQLQHVACPGFPRKLGPFYFFRAVDRLRVGLSGVQVTLSRVRVADLLISGGTHSGHLERGRRWKGPFDLLQLWLERAAYRAPKRIVAHSHLIADELREKYHVPDAKLTTLFPPVDERFQDVKETPSRSDLRARLGWPKDRVVFLFPSSGHRRKGLGPIIEALSFFSDAALLVVAGKPANTGKNPFIRSLGYVEDMAAAYRAADFTILGSYYEPFGLVGPESVLCGTRLVFEQDVGCLPAVASELVVTFSVWDPASIRAAVSRAIDLARRQQHRIALPRAGLNYDPNPEKHARALLDLVRPSALGT